MPKARHKPSPEQLLRRIQELEAMTHGTLQAATLLEEVQRLREHMRQQEEHILSLQLELEASHDRFFELYEFAPIALVSLDRNGLIISGNSTSMHLLQHTPRTLIGRPMTVMVAPEERLAFLNYMRRCRQEDKPHSIELTLMTSTKERLHVQLHTRRVVMEDSRTATYPTAINVVGEETRLREQLRALAASLSLSEERERRRIAVEIHDRISQKLALVKMQLSGMRRSIAPGGEPVIEGALGLLGELLDDTRRLTFELSPPVLYELGFIPALEWLAEQFQQVHKVQVSVESETEGSHLTNDLRVLLFQCTRELLNNVVKHSKAKHVKIALRQTADEVYLSVTDDGIGFDANESPIPPTGITSFGLFSIRQRIEEVGGSFTVVSRMHVGTVAEISVQLAHGANGDIGALHENANPARRRSPDRPARSQESARPAPGHGSGRRGRGRSKGRRAG